MNKMSRTLVAAAMAVAPITMAFPAQAGTPVAAGASVGTVFTFQHAQTGQCLDGSVTQGVRLHPCNGSNYQQWRIKSDSPAIEHVQSGQCLDGSVSQVRLHPCNGSNYQQWRIRANSPAIHRLPLEQNRCLDGSVSQGVRLNTCNGSTYQQWNW